MATVSEVTESKSNGQQRRGDERHELGCGSKPMNGREKPDRAVEPALLIPDAHDDLLPGVTRIVDCSGNTMGAPAVDSGAMDARQDRLIPHDFILQGPLP